MRYAPDALIQSHSLAEDAAPSIETPIQACTDWRPGQPIPRPEVVLYEEYENYRETPPAGLEIDDVELVWWLVAACFNHSELRSRLTPVIAKHRDWSGFSFSPIADLQNNSRYPRAVIQLLRELLPEVALHETNLEVAQESDDVEIALATTLVIQNVIWHELTWAALGIVPVELLPDHLRDASFGVDLGL